MTKSLKSWKIAKPIFLSRSKSIKLFSTVLLIQKILFSDIEIPYLDVALITNNSDSDLIPQVYEGGFKVWECTQDLADFLDEKREFEDKRVCDLGCSAGILGILSLNLGAKSVHFQDYVRLKRYSLLS